LTIDTREDMDNLVNQKKFSKEMDFSSRIVWFDCHSWRHGSIAFQISSVDVATTVPEQRIPTKDSQTSGWTSYCHMRHCGLYEMDAF